MLAIGSSPNSVPVDIGSSARFDRLDEVLERADDDLVSAALEEPYRCEYLRAHRPWRELPLGIEPLDLVLGRTHEGSLVDRAEVQEHMVHIRGHHEQTLLSAHGHRRCVG